MRDQEYDRAANMNVKRVVSKQTRVTQEILGLNGFPMLCIIYASTKKTLTARWRTPFKDAGRDNHHQRAFKTKRYFFKMVAQAHHRDKYELRPLCTTRGMKILARIDILLQYSLFKNKEHLYKELQIEIIQKIKEVLRTAQPEIRIRIGYSIKGHTVKVPGMK